jgi:phage terminase small subunit
MDNRPLTAKQRRFINHYTGDCKGNALQAAKAAKYKGNDNTLGQIGHKLVNNGKVIAAIQAKEAIVAAEVDVTVQEIVSELRAIAFSPTASRPDKLRALELLGRYKAMFIDRHRDETASQPQPFDPAESEAEDLRVLSIQACRLHKPPRSEKGN